MGSAQGTVASRWTRKWGSSDSTFWAGGMSGTDVTKEFERGFAKWHGARYCLGHSTGTGALHGAMFGLGIGTGDEIICPSVTYWASCLPVFSLGGTVVFADIHPETLTIDPGDIEHRISERTKAIVVETERPPEPSSNSA